ncbi:MAG: hypothetical protein WDO68_02385 [Gammaproteobacteria bacterium]
MREVDNNMARSLIVLAGVCAVLFAIQVVFANRRGTESDIKAQLASMVAPAWHFVALEYCYGMLNRTYVVFITDAMICGARVRGLLPAPLAVDERWFDPYFFPRPDIVKRYTRVDLTSPRFKHLSVANFQIPFSEVRDIQFNAAPKWGMGTVPYSGRIHLRHHDGATRELILLGKQDGPALVARLRACISGGPSDAVVRDE